MALSASAVYSAMFFCGFIDADTAGARRAARRYYAVLFGRQDWFVARQELHGRLFWRAVKRCDGDSDASVRGVGEGATRYHAGGDGELRFVKMVSWTDSSLGPFEASPGT